MLVLLCLLVCKMNPLDWTYRKLLDIFAGFNTTGDAEEDQIACSVDSVYVECLSFDLIDRGFHFDVENDWYERTWTVATKNGAETSKEVYQKRGTYWKTMMFGNNGDLFYEQTIGKNHE